MKIVSWDANYIKALRFFGTSSEVMLKQTISPILSQQQEY